MVSKLSFKGEKLRKKKIVRKVLNKEPSQFDVDPELIKTSWSSANEFADLNGPVMITTIERSDDDFLTQRPIALTANDDGVVVPRRDFNTITTPINFPSQEIDPSSYSAIIHKSEPTDIQQVFVIVPLSSLVKGNVNPNRVKVALKSFQDKYLGTDRDTIDSKSDAISQGQMFEFERVVKYKESIYFRIIQEGKKLVFEGGEFKLLNIDQDCTTDLFIIRVQAKNSVEGSRVLREQQEKKLMGGDSVTYAVNQGIESLQKLGVEVNNSTVTRLRNAAVSGKINEQLILEKQKGKSDSRC